MNLADDFGSSIIFLSCYRPWPFANHKANKDEIEFLVNLIFVLTWQAITLADNHLDPRKQATHLPMPN